MQQHTSILFHTNTSNPRDAVLSLINDTLETSFDSLEDSHLIELNEPGLQLKIKDVRDFITKLSYAKRDAATESYILYEIEAASAPAQHALLKALEEPPKQTLIVLTTSQPQAVLPTIRSRCRIIRGEDEKEHESSHATSPQLPSIRSSSYQDLIEKASKLSRGEALQLVRELSSSVLIILEKKPTPATTQLLTDLELTKQYLHANVNTKLALEVLFFQIKNADLSHM